jgi:transcriptional antiterminator RfaH
MGLRRAWNGYGDQGCEMPARDGTEWFVAQTHPRKERVALRHLANQDFGPFLPSIRRTRRHGGRFESVLEPLFPGYVFVAIDVETQRWRSVNGTLGVTRLLTDGDRPLPVRGGFVEALRERADRNGVIAGAAESGLRPGDQVRFSSGPFAELVGRVASLPSAERVDVLLNVLGREVLVRSDAAAVRASL